MHNTHMRRHQRDCAAKKAHDENVQRLTDELKEKDRQIAQLQEENKQANSHNTTTNIENQTNIQATQTNNIVVLAFNDPDFSHLTDADYNAALREKLVRMIPSFLNRVYTDPRAPQNHSVYLSNLQGKHISVYDGTQWQLRPKAEVLPQLIGHSECGMITHVLANTAQFGASVEQKLRRLGEMTNDRKGAKQISDEVELGFYNNRDLVRPQ